jgi:chemotaxis protein methyltransferase WspC
MALIDFEDLLKNTMGLDAASIGSASVERAVRLRMDVLGLRANSYWQHVCGSPGELQELIEAVVVPETWFFRAPEAFAALVRLVAREWRPSAPSSMLRVLSIPCSTGEEPYSIVMSLLDAGFPRHWLHVDAVDISAHALARAARGVYGANSFRGVELGFRERYFRRTAKGYTPADWLRGIVNFRDGNLASPGFSAGEEPYDVIFCRNLLIYFDCSTQERSMKTLARLLTPRGLLFVGPAEAYLASRNGFAAVDRGMSFAFCKTGAMHANSLHSHPTPAGRRAQEGLTPRRAPNINVVSVPAPAPDGPRVDKLEIARKLADAGRLEEAAAWCERNLREQGPSSETYYLLGLVRDAVGDRDGATTFYRKAVYLEPEHVEGLMQLALANQTQGDTAAAERLRQRARRVEERPKEAPRDRQEKSGI